MQGRAQVRCRLDTVVAAQGVACPGPAERLEGRVQVGRIAELHVPGRQHGAKPGIDLRQRRVIQARRFRGIGQQAGGAVEDGLVAAALEAAEHRGGEVCRERGARRAAGRRVRLGRQGEGLLGGLGAELFVPVVQHGRQGRQPARAVRRSGGSAVNDGAQQGLGLGVVPYGITGFLAMTGIAAVSGDAGRCPQVQRDGQVADLGVQVGIAAGLQVGVITAFGQGDGLA